MSFFRVVVLFCSFLLIAIIVHAQDDKPQVKHVPAPMTSATSGKEMFKSYCASCHGPSAKGDGPAAAALKSAPSDLTLLTKGNSGKFPSERVMSILRGQATVTAHGNRDMPVWGPVFWHISQGHESEVQQRIVNLTRYIESLQAK
jgi:mono/diheme cytochrome c family protein